MNLGVKIAEFPGKGRAQVYTLALILIASFFFSACGSKGVNSSPVPSITVPPPATYSIAGSVSGVAGSGLVLQNNAANNIAISQGGSFAFTTPVTSGATYKVTVLTQPSNPPQTCVVTNGTGTAKANVSNVEVTCTTITFTIGGAVQGLAGTGLVLQDNGVDSLSISGDGSFTFANSIWQGNAYSIIVLTQPSNPAQTCSLTNSSGTASANVNSVAVVCTTNSPVGQWAWMGGANVLSQKGTYGSLGTAAPGNIPGARDNAAFWTDAAGNFWLFGGYGLDSTGTGGGLSDLWEYSAGQWTWVGGSNLSDQLGVYGTQGTPDAANSPGARQSAMVWVDASGNFWLFGGSGFDSAGVLGYLNDLWEYHAGEWTWVSGSNLANSLATYGTPGVANSANVPSARSGSVVWTDSAGNHWLFGGFGPGSPATGSLNDLWKYSASQWTWMGGSNLTDQAGVYGARGTLAASNVPGGRNSAVSWTDAAGNFWLFGGRGSDSNAASGDLCDLWMYTAGQWKWVSGPDVAAEPGTYGTQGTASASNFPGARNSAVSWTDAAGNFWLFGGFGLGSTGTSGDLSDLWKYSPAGEWTWMSGPSIANQAGTYGTLGTSSPTNTPGARRGAAGWVDAAGNFWIFGGSTKFNDLWKYQQ